MLLLLWVAFGGLGLVAAVHNRDAGDTACCVVSPSRYPGRNCDWSGLAGLPGEPIIIGLDSPYPSKVWFIIIDYCCVST